MALALWGSTAQAQLKPAESSPVALADLVAEAERVNPAIQAQAKRVEALRLRVPQAKSLPDPQVSVGWAGNIRPFSVQEKDPSSYRGITAMEEFPYPGKLKLRGQIADREAEAARWEYEATRRAVIAELKTAYYDYFFFVKAIETTNKEKDLLDKLAKIAEVRYKVGKGIQQDVLRAQTEVSLLLQRLTVLEQQKKTAQVRINTLLFRDPENPLPPPASFTQAELGYSLESLYQLARENDTGLQGVQRMVERNQYAIDLAQKDYLPDFRVAYMYQQRPDLPDMHGFTAGINIPIFYKTKQRQAVNEATHALAGTKLEQQSRQTTLYFEVKEQYLAAQSSKELTHLFSQTVVPQSLLTLESSMAAYEVGSVDFLTLLTNFITVLDYELNYYRELSNYQMALARLEPLVGVELTK